MNEQELVERCREGDRQAQRELYDRTSERIYRVILKMTANPDDAFDLSQETYLKAFRRIESFDGRSSLATWLYRIAVNETLQFLRRAGRSQARLRHVSRPQDVESEAESTMVRTDVNDALAAVDPTDRAMLLLRYQEGLDYRAIAEVVGCAEGTVASRLNRARQRLRDILRKSYGCGKETDAGGHPRNSGGFPAETAEDGTPHGRRSEVHRS